MTEYTYQELEKIVVQMRDGEFPNRLGMKKEYDIEHEIAQEYFIKAEFPGILENFEREKRDSQHKWHSFVREVFYPPEDLNFLKNNLLELIMDYRNSYKDYFKLSRDENFILPDRIYLLTRLKILFDEFFSIYKNIIQNIHFENPIERIYENNIHGKINWQKTIQMSKTEFPTYFLLERRKREFDHPGNILLVLALKWQQEIVRNFLEINFEQKLEKKLIENLQEMDLRIKNGLLNFPFSDVITEANKYESLDIEHVLIKKLEKQIRIEIKQKIIKNPQYQRLLNWIQDFKKIDFSKISETTSDFSFELIKGIDFAYQGWVFWKIISKFYEKGPLKNLVISKGENYFEFMYNNTEIRFYHERRIKGWTKLPNHASMNEPDFTVYVKPYREIEDLVGIFDVKNTNKIKRQGKQAVALYALDLACDFVGILYNGIKYQENIRIQERQNKKILYFGIPCKEGMNYNNDKILEEFYEQIITGIKSKIKNSS